MGEGELRIECTLTGMQEGAGEVADGTEEEENGSVRCGVVDSRRNVGDLDVAGGTGRDVDWILLVRVK